MPLVAVLGGCELGLHTYQQATTQTCQPWRTGCPAVLDYAQAGAINPPRADMDRSRVVAAAADAPYRQCDTVSLICQGLIIGDVLRDQYIMVLAGNPYASATAASSQPTQTGPTSPPPPAGARSEAEPAGNGRIVRTQGYRAGEVSPSAETASARQWRPTQP
ncbi:MAG: hypothetical protein JNM75_00930 [Rhodospirillales bacterium]|nr:hypothetical protein [Rhodospirillales bacterium]